MEQKYTIDPKNPRLVLLHDGRVALVVDRIVQSGAEIVGTKRRPLRKPKAPNLSRNLALRLMERMVRGETPQALEKETPYSLYTLKNLNRGWGQHVQPKDMEEIRERVIRQSVIRERREG